MDGIFRLPAFCKLEHIETQFVCWWRARIEAAPIPFLEMRMFRMFGVCHGVNKLLVYGESTDVFGRASTSDVG